jgi:hypothetical protein
MRSERDIGTSKIGDIVKIPLNEAKDRFDKAEIIAYRELTRTFTLLWTMKTQSSADQTIPLLLVQNIRGDMMLHSSGVDSALNCYRLVRMDIYKQILKDDQGGDGEDANSFIETTMKQIKSPPKPKIITKFLKRKKFAQYMRGEIQPNLLTCKNGIQKGYLNSFFDGMHYPDMVDTAQRVAPGIIQLTVVIEIINNVAMMLRFDQLNEYRVLACEKMSALVYLVGNWKRRLFGKVEYWLLFQLGFVRLLHNCLQSSNVTYCNTAIEALLNDGSQYSTGINRNDFMRGRAKVKECLFQHMIFLLTVDPMIYLSVNSALLVFDFGVNRHDYHFHLRKTLLPPLVKMLDYLDRHDGENCGLGFSNDIDSLSDSSISVSGIVWFGKQPIPPGMRHIQAGQPFAKVFLLLSAQLVMLDTKLIHDLQQIYRIMNKYPVLREIMEGNSKTNADDADEFLSLKKAAGQIVKWAKKIIVNHDIPTI